MIGGGNAGLRGSPVGRAHAGILISFLTWSTLAPFLRVTGGELKGIGATANYLVLAGVTGLAAIGAARLATGRRPVLPLLSPALTLELGLLSALNVWTMCIAFSFTSIANALLMHYAAPVLVAAVSPMILREKPSARVWAAIALSIAGLLAVARRSFEIRSERDLIGMALALVSAVAYAAITIRMRALARQETDPLGIVISQSVIHTLTAIAFLEPSLMTMSRTGLSAVAGVLHIAIAAPIFVTALKSVPAATAGVLGYSEVFFGMGWGALFFREYPTPTEQFGALLIVAAGVVVLSSPREGNTSQEPLELRR